MNVRELQNRLLALSVPEKTEILQVLIQNLVNSWAGISKTPGIVEIGRASCRERVLMPV